MGKNTTTWLKRSKKKYTLSIDAWADIASQHSLRIDQVRMAHTRYFWRWKVNRLYRRG
ncbi:MAG: hypothetical protein ABJQ69_03770 [Ekhidna sp.]